MKKRNLLTVPFLAALIIFAYGCGGGGGGGGGGNQPNGGGGGTNHSPTWSTAPSNIMITGGSVYNQTNGTATDVDAGQTLTCSSNGTSCGFSVTASGSGSNPQNCNISFTAPASAQTCSLRVMAADSGSPSLTVGQKVTITIKVSSAVAPISAGDYHTCALTTASGVKCWGGNSKGQLGDNSTTDRLTPVDVVGLSSGVVAIAAGEQHTCALTTAGGVKCWGWNASGQIGDGTTTDSWTPVDVVGLSSGVAAISAGSSGLYTCALTTAGGGKCWGNNTLGELGDNTTTQRNSPVDVVGLSSGVAAIATEGGHTCALTVAGGVKCWGGNNCGQIGDNTTTDRHAPVDVVGLSSGVTAISAGGATCVLTTAGGVKCWGLNANGQIGDNTTINRLTPVDVVGLSSGVAAISAGYYHTCALIAAGGVKCWGRNDYGQLGDNTTIERYAPVDVVGL